MKTLYLQCNMGAAGDMLMASLWELLPDRDAFLTQMNALGLPGITVTAEPAVKCGVTGTHMAVTVNGKEEGVAHPHHHVFHLPGHHHHHSHHGVADIEKIISGLNLPEKVRADALSVYGLIAAAESHVHGKPMEQIHFHEVGSLDALADVVGVCLALHLLAPEQVLCSPVHVGSGMVRCAHGLLPVPAPATAHILQGIPTYGGSIQGELCTPTGAALLKHFAADFGDMPVLRVEKTGYGMGKKDFPAANCVRAFWGETQSKSEPQIQPEKTAIVELCCHIDDMTAEALAFAGERLMAQGALDVSSAPLTMKKGRSGLAFTVLCKPQDEERLAVALLRETTTNGVRVRRCGKYILNPSIRMEKTAYGTVRFKCADGYGIHREKPEYEDVAASARAADTPFWQVWQDILRQTESTVEKEDEPK